MTSESQSEAKFGSRPHLPRLVWTVIKAAELLPLTTMFAALYIISVVLVAICEPQITGLGDAAWYLFTVVSTVGFGDFTCSTIVGRLVTAAISFYSVFYFAIVTGTVVNYCGERLKCKRDESVAAFIDKLERLPELSHDELVELSNKIKKMDPR